MAVDRPDGVPGQGRRRGPRVPWRLRLSVRASCAAIAFLILVVSGYAWATYQNFTASVPHGDAVPALAAGQRDLDGSAQNILLIGNDSRNGATPAELAALGPQDE